MKKFVSFFSRKMSRFVFFVVILLFIIACEARLRGASPRQVFNKGYKISGKNPKEYRKDAYGNTLKFSDYGKNKPTGWHVDHIKPKSKGGADTLKNYQPLQAQKNMSLGNSTNKKSLDMDSHE